MDDRATTLGHHARTAARDLSGSHRMRHFLSLCSCGGRCGAHRFRFGHPLLLVNVRVEGKRHES